jgi:hypothetical protein
MSYLAQLKEKIGNANPQSGTDKTAKSPFVSSVSTDSAIASGIFTPTTTGNAELDSLIEMVANEYNCPPDERLLMIETAQRDLGSALTSFRAMANQRLLFNAVPIPDDRVTCSACSNLTRRGLCLSAQRGEMADTYKRYSPVPDVFRHCEHFKSRLH